MFALEVFNPVAQMEGETKVSGAAIRPHSLDGITLGLLWNSKRGGEVALKKAGELIKNKFKNVTVNFYTGHLPSSKDLLKKAAQECDVFVGSTAD